MSDSDNNCSNSLINLIPKSIDNAIENVTDAPTKSMGQTLSDCWYLIFGGISQAAEKKKLRYAIELDKFKNELTSSLESVPNEFKIEADSHITLLALNNAKFCVEKEELRKMYVNLLTASVDSRKTVHPSFPQIILSMDYVDAVILNEFKKDSIIPICDYQIHEQPNHGGYNNHATNVLLSRPKEVSIPDAARSLDSLKRLGLIDIPDDLHITEKNVYDIFKHTDIYNDLLVTHKPEQIVIREKVALLTNLGTAFINCCL